MSTTSTLADTAREDRDLEKAMDPNLLANSADAGLERGIAKEISSGPESQELAAANGATPAQLPKALDWDGPEDPDNPKNWHKFWKVYSIVVPGLISFIVTFGTSVYTPTVPAVMAKYHVSQTAALLGLTLYTMGLVAGPMLGAPISETHGRKVVFLITFPLSLLFHLGSGLANSFAALLVCRFFAGTFGSPALAIGAGSIADVFDLHISGAPAAAFFIMMPFLGPSAGPFIGSFVVGLGSRWFAWMPLIIGAPVFVMLLFMRESYKPIILARRAKKRGLPLPPRPPRMAMVKVLVTVTIVRPFEMLVVEPIVGLMSLYTGFAFGVLFIFFEGFPYSFTLAYHFTRQQVGLTFLGLGLGIIIAGLMFVVIDRTIYQPIRRRVAPAMPDPEHRLYAAMVGSFLIPIGIFWFAWTTYPSIHWISPVLAGLVFGWGNFSIFLSIMTYTVDTYQARAGASAAAANGVVRYTLGAVFPLFAFQMYSGLGRHLAGTVLGAVSVAMLPIPWVFFKWGAQIRKRSKYAAAVVGAL